MGLKNLAHRLINICAHQKTDGARMQEFWANEFDNSGAELWRTVKLWGEFRVTAGAKIS